MHDGVVLFASIPNCQIRIWTAVMQNKRLYCFKMIVVTTACSGSSVWVSEKHVARLSKFFRSSKFILALILIEWRQSFVLTDWKRKSFTTLSFRGCRLRWWGGSDRFIVAMAQIGIAILSLPVTRIEPMRFVLILLGLMSQRRVHTMYCSEVLRN